MLIRAGASHLPSESVVYILSLFSQGDGTWQEQMDF